MRSRITAPEGGTTYVRSSSGRTIRALAPGESIVIDAPGHFALEQEPEAGYVQVTLVGDTAQRRWTYRDPLFDLNENPIDPLEVGDLVRIPFGFTDRLFVAKVVALGRGQVPEGVEIKRVAQFLDPIDL